MMKGNNRGFRKVGNKLEKISGKTAHINDNAAIQGALKEARSQQTEVLFTEIDNVGHAAKAVNLAHKAALYIDDTELPDFESMLHNAKESAAKSLNVPPRMITGDALGDGFIKMKDNRCMYCGEKQPPANAGYSHKSDCPLLQAEFAPEIAEPVFLPVANLDFENECPATGISHEYMVEMIPLDMDNPKNGLFKRVIQCRNCGHELKERTRYDEMEEMNDDSTIKTRDLVICSILLVVAVITIAAHWIFGG